MSKTAIITGASSGIGAATAHRFIELGHKVINIARRASPVEGVINISADLSTEEGAKRAALEAAESAVKGESISLVHNASLMLKDTVHECDTADLMRVLAVNVAAVNTLNRELLPHMVAGSSILYVGSTLSEKAVAGAHSYVISKHAQLGQMRATCQDLIGAEIHTAMICPGFTDTEMLKQHLGGDTELMHEIGSQNSFGRLVTPDEIASVITWAHQSPVVNGTVIHANLGQMER
ncbi:MAG: short-chain dehydrogenase [Cellvibrionales bacterium TMED79]|nr:short-chain dehydrogenase [Halieaceae bacterium]OUU98550.1 MAG: short-chain dehydrogenase [Cellvibrionales bacterium TMED79]